WVLSRQVQAVGRDIGSTAVRADAWHHLSDAITSAAAFIGIAVALWGVHTRRGGAWAAADDWAALLAAGIIAYNGYTLLRAAVDDLMDRMPGDDVVEPVRRIASVVEGVRTTEKLFVRKVGLGYRVTIHVQADPAMRLDDAHALGHRVQQAILDAEPRVSSVLVHMEPYVEGLSGDGPA
ncbi:MAG TPA: cation diffusion facilitator family transporter, partial [Gemmatimonadaceae bacterium]|nr:cation diffusion facilitator family transporter [Gemmatimonadaceae bacterium]